MSQQVELFSHSPLAFQAGPPAVQALNLAQYCAEALIAPGLPCTVIGQRYSLFRGVFNIYFSAISPEMDHHEAEQMHSSPHRDGLL